MKKIVNIKRTPVILDTETFEIHAIPEKTRSIDSVYIVPEDAELHWESRDFEPVDTTVEKNDILITFYNDDFGRDFVVVKSEDWLNMLHKADGAIQERKEKWAAERSESANKDC